MLWFSCEMKKFLCFATPLAFPTKAIEKELIKYICISCFLLPFRPLFVWADQSWVWISVFCFNNKVSPRTPLTSPIFGLFAICYLLIAPARQRLCVLHQRHICQVSDFNWVLAFLRKQRCFWSPLRVGFPCIFPLLLTHLLPHSLAWTLGLSGAFG